MKITFLLLLSILPFLSVAQSPAQFKYQSVARDLLGVVISNAPVGVQISIHDLTASGTVVFSETHLVTTNDFGLFTLSVGDGTPTIGTLGSVDWANGSKYMEVEADLTGGTAYASFGVTQLLSVPYALYANASGTPILPNGTAIGNTTYWNGTTWVVNSSAIYNNGSRVGIGSNTPLQRLDVAGNINLSQDSSLMFGNRRILSILGTNNLFIGDFTGTANTNGNNNVFAGYNSGVANILGGSNAFFGAETGVGNTYGELNSFLGRRAGMSNTVGNENTFLGAYAGQSTTEGDHNSFLGVTAGSENTLGEENTFLGAHAGYFNTEGSFNSFVGNFSGLTNDFGNFNTLMGFQANLALGGLVNASAFGYGAIANSSNSVMIGNTFVTTIGGQVGWSTFSDKRLKTDIQENTLGLEFINRLSTVNYEYTAEGQKNIRYTGLIAQDVETILESMNMSFSGLVKPKNEKDFYSIRYAEFVTPLIKAVQEQSVIIKDLELKNESLEERVTRLEAIIEQLSLEQKN